MTQEGVIKDLFLLACVGIHTVLVHGGGSWLKKLGIEANFKNGLRVTDGMSCSGRPLASACSPACSQASNAVFMPESYRIVHVHLLARACLGSIAAAPVMFSPVPHNTCVSCP